MLTLIEQETLCLRDELRKADPVDLGDWLTFLKSWFETEDENREFRQSMRNSLKTIALAILREWASIMALKAIPQPTSTASTWDR